MPGQLWERRAGRNKGNRVRVLDDAPLGAVRVSHNGVLYNVTDYDRDWFLKHYQPVAKVER